MAPRDKFVGPPNPFVASPAPRSRFRGSDPSGRAAGLLDAIGSTDTGSGWFGKMMKAIGPATAAARRGKGDMVPGYKDIFGAAADTMISPDKSRWTKASDDAKKKRDAASMIPPDFSINVPGVPDDDDDDDGGRSWWKDLLTTPRKNTSGWDPSDLSLLLASGALGTLGGGDSDQGPQRRTSYEGGDPNWDPSRLGQVAAAEQMRNTQDLDHIFKRGTRIGGQVSSQGLRFQRAPGLGGGSMPLFQMGPMGRDVANYAPDRGAVDPDYLTGDPLRPQGSVSPSLLPGGGGGVPQQAQAVSGEFTGGEGGGDPVESLLQTYTENAQQPQPGAQPRKPRMV
jgi:hypothetical protein